MGGDLSHAVSLEYEAVCIVDEPIENSVGDGGVGDHLVPVIDWHLAGDDGGTTLMPIVNDLEKFATLIADERSYSPVVEDEEFDAR